MTPANDCNLSATADDLLWRWGQWSRHHIGLGYPRENPIGRVMREGPGAGHATVITEIPMPRDLEVAERAVLAMAPDIRRAIKFCYIQQLTDKQGAKKCKCGRTEYRARIERGVMFVAGRLSIS